MRFDLCYTGYWDSPGFAAGQLLVTCHEVIPNATGAKIEKEVDQGRGDEEKAVRYEHTKKMMTSQKLQWEN